MGFNSGFKGLMPLINCKMSENRRGEERNLFPYGSNHMGLSKVTYTNTALYSKIF